MFFDYTNLKFHYDPYPVGLIKPLMDEATYREFVNRFPPVETMTSHAETGRQGDKYTLSEKLDRRRYRQFVMADPIWREFHRWVKSDDFVYGLLTVLQQHSIDLGFRRLSPLARAGRYLAGRVKGKIPGELARLKARYEFSALSQDGGHLLPHTDSPGKIVTLVVSILGDDGWDPAIGGGTDIDQPKRDELKFNYVNNKADFADMERVHSFDYAANQAVIFVKTHNSWHSVRPMTGRADGPLRKTLTINLETVS